MFFEKQGPVWETLRDLEKRLDDAGIPFVIIGGLALNAYQYPRQTIDVDLVLRKGDFDEFVRRFSGTAYERKSGASRRFMDRQHDVPVDVLIAGELAGHHQKNRTIRFPDPDERQIEGHLATVSLPRLIELKLVTWRFKDWGDVVELIRRNGLTDTFAEQLDPSIRTAYMQCCDQATDKDYENPHD